ncbi:6-aminohexanoate hydrolase [Bacillus cereus]|uniref:6-aminohexanoate hydrolase n=1 Tax=Bacillus TaxID=1386 RepID=UPI0018C44A97|nr:6-aminohexanoate hydrolase [Bacillus sp. SRB3LM]MBJ8204062.1 6-aminohexanoate hydrolase [Bacillus cereus]MBG0971728.1 6-aminohexanoate hydrolase [Bacillus sp. SRB3LM]MCU4824842.1 6-aminohexanoate hydrolase [Bacillus cereus]MCU4857773.1 6-aminohexanoate hydrolase [Bacillus cereus]MCU4875136.1 6-aminohexanoate hydrolase [Bacillus cereus]
MLDLLNNWMSESTDNFNIIVGFISLLLVGSTIVLFIMMKKFGQPDERTNAIYLKIISCMFGTQIVTNAIFISLVSKDMYFRQFFILFEGIVFFVGAIYSVRLYRKEFK